MDGHGRGGSGDPSEAAASFLHTVLPGATTDGDVLSNPPHVLSNTNHDALLTYSYQLYDLLQQQPGPLPRPEFAQDVYRTQLLPLLNSLKTLRRGDIATLLLLACVHHALGDYQSSINASQEILAIDPHCAEAMYNIGTSTRALGLEHEPEAFSWWWKAFQARPTYWDAIDNVLALLIPPSPWFGAEASAIPRALEVCAYVQRHVFDAQGNFIRPIPPSDLHRLQRVLCTAGSIKSSTTEFADSAVLEILRAIEIAFRSPLPQSTSGPIDLREIILSICIAGYVVYSESGGLVPDSISPFLPSHSIDVWQTVRGSADILLKSLIQEGGGTLPFILLLPHQTTRILTVLFPSSSGVLPAICTQDSTTNALQLPPEAIRQQTNLATSTALLALAKQYQEAAQGAIPVPGLEHVTSTGQSLALLLYYLALGLFPSPSTFNNMGIILTTVTSTRNHSDTVIGDRILTGMVLAKIYYEAGLKIDPNHPHLLTNLGSLIKDQGRIDVSIQYYRKAIATKPDFDIALANLANAIKDEGRPWEAIEYYNRALVVNPRQPEALCGLVSSLCATCDWRGLGGLESSYVGVDGEGNLSPSGLPGYLEDMVRVCSDQAEVGYTENREIPLDTNHWLSKIAYTYERDLSEEETQHWVALLTLCDRLPEGGTRLNRGGSLLRLIDWIQPRLQRRWYVTSYGTVHSVDSPVVPLSDPSAHLCDRLRPPQTMTPPVVPALLPFNTFSHPLSTRFIRLITHRYAMRISYATAIQPWIPSRLYPPPPPPVGGVLRIGYVSNDINNHPLSHLMQSVFGLHDRRSFQVFVYATSPWDGSPFRAKIATEVYRFVDVSTWTPQSILEDITKNQIHILINLGGYTKGARNDLFAARPCPLQIQLVGYASTLSAGWCDYLVCDPIACPPELCASEYWRNSMRSPESLTKADNWLDLGADLDPESTTDAWLYSEKFIYMPHSFMVTDHKQSFPAEIALTGKQTPVSASTLWDLEEFSRAEMRLSIFPRLPQDFIIFANFNQLYKIDPGIFSTWLKILARVPHSILWLLRFPPAGEQNLLRTARLWAGEEVASRVQFTDVAPKEIHIARGRVPDLFLDTVECNAHTTAADVLWSGTPILTWPKHKHKMCSRVAASMAYATGFGDQMVVNSAQEYEDRAVQLATEVHWHTIQGADGRVHVRPQGDLMTLRRNIILNRNTMPLFDTLRWTRNLEKGFREAWRRWVEGTQYEMSDEWQESQGPEKESGCIWVKDNDPIVVVSPELATT